MKITGIARAVLAVACAMSVGNGADAADVYQPIGVPMAPGCNAGYSWQKIGARYQCVTPQPSCAYGFASGPAWNGSTWVYSCNAPPPPPPPPTCPSGYDQKTAPWWNGSAWVGQQCIPAAKQPTGPNPQICQAYVTQKLGFWPGWGQQNWTYDDGKNTTYTTNTWTASVNEYEFATCSVSDSTGAVTGYEVQGYGDTSGYGG